MDQGGTSPGGGPPPSPPAWAPPWPAWPNDPPPMPPPAWYPPGYPVHPGHPWAAGPTGHPGHPPYPGYPGWLPHASPPHPATPYLASTGDRVGAFLIDAVVLLLLALPMYVLVFALFFGLASSENTFFATPLVLFPLMLLPMLLPTAYAALTEGRTGQSLGKRALGIRVVKIDGRPIAWHDAVIRWICLMVDQQPTLGILGLILISSRPLKQRVGDLAAGTIVVRTGR